MGADHLAERVGIPTQEDSDGVAGLHRADRLTRRAVADWHREMLATVEVAGELAARRLGELLGACPHLGLDVRGVEAPGARQCPADGYLVPHVAQQGADVASGR